MVSLVHEPLVVLDLVVEFLLDVVLHLVRDQATRNLICNLAEEGEVVGCEVLTALLVGHFEDADGVVAQFDRDQQHVAHYLVQLLIHGEILAKLFTHRLVLCALEVPRLTRIEYLAEDVGAVAFALETHWLAQTAGDDLAKELVFDAVVEED